MLGLDERNSHVQPLIELADDINSQTHNSNDQIIRHWLTQYHTRFLHIHIFGELVVHHSTNVWNTQHFVNMKIFSSLNQRTWDQESSWGSSSSRKFERCGTLLTHIISILHTSNLYMHSEQTTTSNRWCESSTNVTASDEISKWMGKLFIHWLLLLLFKIITHFHALNSCVLTDILCQ